MPSMNDGVANPAPSRHDASRVSGEYVVRMSEPPANPLLQSSQPAFFAPGDVSNGRPVPLSAYQDYSMGHQDSPTSLQSFNGSFGGNMLTSPRQRAESFPYPPPGSVSNISDERNSEHLPRLSVGSAGAFSQQRGHGSMDGSDPRSPESARGSGPGSGDNLGGDMSLTAIAVANAGLRGPEEGSPNSRDDKAEAPPPWSELKTKAGKERKRLPLACIACRRKKIRCSGEKPACKHCLRSRIPCVYKVTTRKAAPRTDYMAMLDKRLKRMEERVIKIIPKKELGSVATVERAILKPPLPGPPSKSAGSKKRPVDEAFGTELDEWANSKPTNPPPGNSTRPPKGQDTEENKLLTEGAESLPSSEIQHHLAEVFFDYIYGQSYYLLHKPSFMRKLSAGTVPPVLILAVCAISARFSTHPQVRTEPVFLRGEGWASAARDIALRRYDTPNITILIVYLILGLHEFGTCQGGRSWMFGGMAQRMAYALQLHKDLDHDPSGRDKNTGTTLTSTDREIRRRTMWACFVMDRFNSSGTDRPMFVQEQYIQAQLPIKESYFQMEISGPTEDLDGSVPNPVEANTGQLGDAKANMGVAAYLIRLVALWGQTVKYMNLGGKEKDQNPMWSAASTFTELKTHAADFKSSLPTTLHYNAENLQNHASQKTANQFLFVHIAYNQVVLHLNRFALSPIAGGRPSLPKDMPQSFLSDARHAALDAANQISVLIKEAMDHLVVAPFAGYCAFSSSTVHIHGVFSKNPQLEASSKQHLAYNVKYLSKMKKYWGMFHFVAENLKDLYRQHADAALRGPSTPSEKANQAAIFQYGDWFDRYPHGVSRTDYEEPAVPIKKEPGTDAVLSQKSDLKSVEEFFASQSPPSKTTDHRRMVKKKAKTGKEQQPTPQMMDLTASTDLSQPQQLPLHQQQQQHQGHIIIPQDTMNPQYQSHLYDQRQHQAYPPQTQFHPNLSLMQPHQPGVMSELDRHLVLSSYAGVDPPTLLQPTNNTNTHTNAFISDFDTSGLGNMWTGADPSSAWFMPFNMDPPDVGDDPGMFGALQGYQFSPQAYAADPGQGAQNMDGSLEGVG
ncbi:hypothetical protein LTR04_005717 [Oleoguttula sp. CCFEE 6159]|nr:hypothetical protein LTR04_005717 [Oleoguttula sp. CCFEE 6159]